MIIEFKDEIAKYKPIRSVEESDEPLKDEVLDIMDLLQYVSLKSKPAGGDKR